MPVYGKTGITSATYTDWRAINPRVITYWLLHSPEYYSQSCTGVAKQQRQFRSVSLKDFHNVLLIFRFWIYLPIWTDLLLLLGQSITKCVNFLESEIYYIKFHTSHNVLSKP